MQTTIELFDSRLNTLVHLLDQATAHFQSDEFFEFKLIEDMLPFGTQVAFTCNQPHNFCQWLRGEEVVLIEDVVSSGGAIIDQLSLLAEDDVKPIGILCVIDRQTGGSENLAREEYRLDSVLKMEDIDRVG